MKVAVVAMPWSSKDRPAAALGALGAFVRRERPHYGVILRHEFLSVAEALGTELYDAISYDQPYSIGELIYLSILYPPKREECRSYVNDWARKQADIEATFVFEQVTEVLTAHLGRVADALASCDVVGMTTCFGQLFANILLARLLKQRNPYVVTVLGGSTISARVGPSILEEYAWVDYIVQGEGERPFVALLDQLTSSAAPAHIDGLVSRKSGVTQGPATMLEVAKMDDLPIPAYDEYAEHAEALGLAWSLPMEGSRGCWWDRTKRTQNPRNTCYFCNLNVQWNGYRQKSAQRIGDELRWLSDRYKNLRIYFLDNILRANGVAELAHEIQKHGKQYEIFYELRAHMRPIELLVMWEAGLQSVQFGIEALSTNVLKRIGKGTTLIQNLQVMRACYELGISNRANLITHFPGTTATEVEETAHNLLTYAICYGPLNLSRFHLGVDSTVDTLRAEFGLTGVRNMDVYRYGMPDDVWRRLTLFDLDFDAQALDTDWQPVEQAVARCETLHKGRTEPVVSYRDGGSFLVLSDDRTEEHREGIYEGLAREVYLYCMEIRSRDAISARFADHGDAIAPILEEFVDQQMMFTEQGKYLSLAVAIRPDIAVRRMRMIGA